MGIYGEELRVFLEKRNANHKRQLAFNQLKCLKCQEITSPLLMQADSIFIDESVQVLKTMLTSELMHGELAEKLTAAIKIAITNGAAIYFTDADQTTEAIRHWQQLLELNDNEILLVTTEPPERHFEVNVTCSISKRYVTIHHVRRKAIFGAGWLISMQKNAHIPVYAALFLHRDQPTCTQI